MLHCWVKWDACFETYPTQGGRVEKWIFPSLPSFCDLTASSLYGFFLKMSPPEFLRHCFQDAAASTASPCHLTLLSSVVLGGLPVDLAKSLMTTLSSPSLRTQRCTTRRAFCNLRSSANRWGSVRTGRSRSFSRDSLITSLSLYSGWASSWRRSSVELFILR